MTALDFEFFVATKELPKDLLGVMSSEGLLINREISCLERQTTVQQLEKAKKLGYNSCVVTRDGTYVTKKLNP